MCKRLIDSIGRLLANDKANAGLAGLAVALLFIVPKTFWTSIKDTVNKRRQPTGTQRGIARKGKRHEGTQNGTKAPRFRKKFSILVQKHGIPKQRPTCNENLL